MKPSPVKGEGIQSVRPRVSTDEAKLQSVKRLQIKSCDLGTLSLQGALTKKYSIQIRNNNLYKFKVLL